MEIQVFENVLKISRNKRVKNRWKRRRINERSCISSGIDNCWLEGVFDSLNWNAPAEDVRCNSTCTTYQSRNNFDIDAVGDGNERLRLTPYYRPPGIISRSCRDWFRRNASFEILFPVISPTSIPFDLKLMLQWPRRRSTSEYLQILHFSIIWYYYTGNLCLKNCSRELLALQFCSN